MNPIMLRLAVIAVALVIWFWTQQLIARQSAGLAGIGDGIHRLTAGWHRYFLTHEKAANRALAVSSFLIDAHGNAARLAPAVDALLK